MDTADDVDGSADRVYGAVAPDGYVLVDATPSVDEFQRLRASAEMAERSREAVERGLPNTTFGVHVRTEASDSDSGDDAAGAPTAPTASTASTAGDAVAMARIVGDGGSVFHVSDMAVAAEHQRQGLGTAMMDGLVGYLKAEAPEGAYVNLMADVDGFYEQWGCERTAPESKGMYLRTEWL